MASSDCCQPRRGDAGSASTTAAHPAVACKLRRQSGRSQR
jgi:hypothetical protein